MAILDDIKIKVDLLNYQPAFTIDQLADQIGEHCGRQIFRLGLKHQHYTFSGA